MAAASTSRYPAENHWRSVSVACSAVESVGRATLSTVPSSPTASTASMSAPSAHHLRVPVRYMAVHLHLVGYHYLVVCCQLGVCPRRRCGAVGLPRDVG